MSECAGYERQRQQVRHTFNDELGGRAVNDRDESCRPQARCVSRHATAGGRIGEEPRKIQHMNEGSRPHTVNTYKIWANAMKNTPEQRGQVMSEARCGKEAGPTDKDFGNFGLFHRFWRWKPVKAAGAELFDGVLDHRAAKADERNTCHYGDKGYPSAEQA